MTDAVKIGEDYVGDGNPVYVIAEIGLNHNGSVEIAKKLIDVAVEAGAQAVKFQKRTPDIATPEHMKSTPRETPWGTMTYLEYRYKVEFEQAEYAEIDAYCKEKGVVWFASPWDEPSVDFLESMDAVAYKIASASVTDLGMLRKIKETGKPVILSTGMSTIEQIDTAVETLGKENLIILHATSTYPLPPEEANLRMIQTLKDRYGVPVGYSGHEPGLQISIAAVALGAVAVERHITLDRTMWGSDHAASLEPKGFINLCRDIRIIETALGDGVKKVFPGELAPLSKLRRVDG
ncbi:N-acetylneuraminate synthase family protein [Demequina maris]|uniref:N-acetylneuraminate synthase family protein n=1 Tax=Demequina maris TaxID=1638982 RepID=UPI0007805D24|nr:N-acetylneuraminate synthase family protein [Demequina maris]